MNRMEAIEARRAEILKEMGGIKSLQRGSITEQYLKVRRKGRGREERRGPYYVFSRRSGGRTVSRRLTTAEELASARAGVAASQRFRALCREFEELTERLGEFLPGSGMEAEKKRRRRR